LGHHLNRLQRKAFEACVPLNVTFEITLRCNLRCLHCYNFDRELPYAPGKGLGDELSDPEVHRILDEIRAAGCLFLAFTGGEALLHPSLGDFIRHAREAGMSVRIKSNGSLLGPGASEKLAAAGASAVDVSLYGARAETHDGFVKRPGAFASTVAGARRAAEAGLETRLTFIILRQNADEIGPMIETAETLGIPYTLDPQISARYDGSRSSLDHRLDRETLDRLFRGPLRPLLPAPDPGRDSVQCPCARSVCGITAFGIVVPCIGAPMPAGDLRRQSFHDVWDGSPVFRWIRGLTLEDFPACRSCEHLAYCPRSSGMVYANTGRYDGPERFGEDWTCVEAEVFHRIHDDEKAACEAASSSAALFKLDGVGTTAEPSQGAAAGESAEPLD
jgi:radical SAM protein with 4Fe4S-binding SPASM domain